MASSGWNILLRLKKSKSFNGGLYSTPPVYVGGEDECIQQRGLWWCPFKRERRGANQSKSVFFVKSESWEFKWIKKLEYNCDLNTDSGPILNSLKSSKTFTSSLDIYMGQRLKSLDFYRVPKFEVSSPIYY